MLRFLAPPLFVFFWSTGFIVARAVVPHAEVQLFLLYRFGSVALVLGVVAIVGRAPLPRLGEAARHVVVGAVMMGLYIGLSYWAIAHGLPAGIMALIGALQPLFTAVLMLRLGRARPSKVMWLGLLTGFSGVVIVLSPQLQGGGLMRSTSVGIAAGIVSVIALSLGTLAAKRLAADDLRVAGCLQNIGAAAITAIAFAIFGTVKWDGTPVLWWTLVWAVLVSSILAQSLLMWMLRHGEATRVTALLLLVPPVAATMAFFLFRETLTTWQLFGFTLALAGVGLSRRVVS